MSTMKKLIGLVLMLMLTFSVALSFAACDNNDNGDNTGGNGDNSTGDNTGNNTGNNGNGNGNNNGDNQGGNSGDEGREPLPELPPAKDVKPYTVIVKDQNNNFVKDVEVKIIDYTPDSNGTANIKGGKTGTTDETGQVSFNVNQSDYLKAMIVSVPEGYVVGTYTNNKTELKYNETVSFVNYEAVINVVKPVGYVIVAFDVAGNLHSGVKISYTTGAGDSAVTYSATTNDLGIAVLDVPARAAAGSNITVSLEMDDELYYVPETIDFNDVLYQAVIVMPARGTTETLPADFENTVTLAVGETRYYNISFTAGQTLIAKSEYVTVKYNGKTYTADAGSGVVLVPLGASAGSATVAISSVDTEEATVELALADVTALSDGGTIGTMAKGASAWYSISYTAGKVLVIESADVWVVYRNVIYTPQNGVIKIALNANGTTAVFEVIAKEAVSSAVVAQVVAPQ